MILAISLLTPGYLLIMGSIARCLARLALPPRLYPRALRENKLYDYY